MDQVALSRRTADTMLTLLDAQTDDGGSRDAAVDELRRALTRHATPATTLTVQCLGEFRIAGVHGWVDSPAAKRGRDLLQYLVLRPRQPVARVRLCDAFWPDADGDSVTHRLHIAVSGARAFLRDILDGVDAIRCTNDGYAWHPAVNISSDVVPFVEHYEAGSPAAYKRAVALYHGDLFEGETADWLQPARVKYAAMYASMVEHLALLAFDAGAFAVALHHGLQLLDIDRAHEGASRLVMRSFQALGRRGPAIAEFESLRAYLRKHLGIDPMPETRRVVEAIISGETPRSAVI